MICHTWCCDRLLSSFKGISFTSFYILITYSRILVLELGRHMNITTRGQQESRHTRIARIMDRGSNISRDMQNRSTTRRKSHSRGQQAAGASSSIDSASTQKTFSDYKKEINSTSLDLWKSAKHIDSLEYDGYESELEWPLSSVTFRDVRRMDSSKTLNTCASHKTTENTLQQQQQRPWDDIDVEEQFLENPNIIEFGNDNEQKRKRICLSKRLLRYYCMIHILVAIGLIGFYLMDQQQQTGVSDRVITYLQTEWTAVKNLVIDEGKGDEEEESRELNYNIELYERDD